VIDPIFILALIIGPLALIFVYEGERYRERVSQWPRIRSLVLALPAAYGTHSWLLAGYVVATEPVTDAKFRTAMFAAIPLAVLIVIGVYWLAVRKRRRDLGTPQRRDA